MSNSDEAYFSYLQRRSNLGYLYRNYWLYPKLCGYLNGKILDVGCGIGDLLRYRKNSVGVDINSETVKYCQSQGFDAYLMEFDKLPFKSGSFDGVVLDNVLEHIEDPSLLLHEIKRVLVPDGCVLLGVPGSKGFARDSDHKVFYSKNKLISLMIDNGFITDTTFSMPLNWRYFDKLISQYCVYGIFSKSGEL